MSRRSEKLFKIVMILTDICSIVFSYIFSFFIRTNIDSRPYYFNERPVDFLSTILLLVPIWVVILAALGLYKKEIIFHNSHIKEIFRLITASVLGIMAIITVSFLKNENIFPVRLVALYSFFLCSFFLIVSRLVINKIRKSFLRKGHHGITFVLIVGNNSNAKSLAEHFKKHPESGYRVAGIVAGRKYIPQGMKNKQFSSTKEALKKCQPDVIFQTDNRHTEYVYKQALDRYIPYYYVPSEEMLSSQLGEPDLIGETPVILVKTTPLNGNGAVLKRFCDIFISSLALLVLSIPMFIIWLIVKLSDGKNPAIYSDIRLTKNNKKFKIYKFRSIKSEYCGMLPEEAFAKMGKPELSQKYRKNGDFLENDPRITKIGVFLRKTSLDELPQFLNILKGDISLVGPRALVPNELRNYGDRSQLLTVKSGLTGLAQVSGRRDISFEERRRLDLYYIRSWSIMMDLQILLKTLIVIIKGDGAK